MNIYYYSIFTFLLVFLFSCQKSSFDKGKKSFDKNDYTDAVLYFSDCIKEDSSKWEAYFYRGISYKNLDKLDNAEKDLLMVLSMAPDPPLDAYGHIGDIYFKQGYTNNALLYFRSAALRDEFKPFINFNIGLCYFDLEFPERAIYYLKKEIRYNPSYPYSYYVIGDLFYSQNEHDSALYYLDIGLKLNSNEAAYNLKRKILKER